MIIRVLVSVAAILLALSGSAIAGCLKNADGACMTLGKGVPYWGAHADHGDYGHFGKYCVTGCYPGFHNVYGYSAATRAEIERGHINWARLEREYKS